MSICAGSVDGRIRRPSGTASSAAEREDRSPGCGRPVTPASMLVTSMGR